MWLWSLLILLFTCSSVTSSFQGAGVLITDKKTLPRQHVNVGLPRPLSKLNCINTDAIETISAAAAIACSSLLGMKLNNKTGKFEGVGQLITIVAASHFTSLGFSPASNRFYDSCWQCLPASLSLLLLSPIIEDNGKVPSETNNESCRKMIGRDAERDAKTNRSRLRDATKREIKAVSIPFFFGCLGSILGCLLSYFYCWLGRNNAVRVHEMILPGRRHYLFKPGRLLYEPSEAAVSAGCLASNYIGGTLNYLASAKIIGSADLKNQVAATCVLSGTFGSVASDMLVMPMYLGTLSLITSSKLLRRCFPGRATTSKDTKVKDQSPNIGKGNEIHWQDEAQQRIHYLLLTSLILSLVGAIVTISDAFETRMQVQGLSLFCNCLLSTFITNSVRPFLARHPRILSHTSQVTSTLSDACYFILIAVIGVSINLRCLTLEFAWSSASSLIFTSVPLLVHFIVIVAGSLAMMKSFPWFKSFPLSVEEVVVASNTAICGPIAASTLVAQMKAVERKDTLDEIEWKGLTIAGVFWGIFGYAVATYVGVSISSTLLSTIH